MKIIKEEHQCMTISEAISEPGNIVVFADNEIAFLAEQRDFYCFKRLGDFLSLEGESKKPKKDNYSIGVVKQHDAVETAIDCGADTQHFYFFDDINVLDSFEPRIKSGGVGDKIVVAYSNTNLYFLLKSDEKKYIFVNADNTRAIVESSTSTSGYQAIAKMKRHEFKIKECYSEKEFFGWYNEVYKEATKRIDI